ARLRGNACRRDPLRRAAKVILCGADIAENLRTQRLGRFELALVAHPAKELHADAAGRGPFERIQEKGLNGEFIARAERRTVADVTDRIPAPSTLFDGARDVDTASRDHF